MNEILVEIILPEAAHHEFPCRVKISIDFYLVHLLSHISIRDEPPDIPETASTGPKGDSNSQVSRVGAMERDVRDPGLNIFS